MKTLGALPNVTGHLGQRCPSSSVKSLSLGARNQCSVPRWQAPHYCWLICVLKRWAVWSAPLAHFRVSR